LSQMEDAGKILYAVECVADGVCTGAGGIITSDQPVEWHGG
jgi:hypothetical protein